MSPRPPPYQSHTETLYEGWRKYLIDNYSRSVASTYYSYGKRYGHLLFSRCFSSLKQLKPEKRLHIIRALCCLSKFVGEHDIFKQLMKAYDLKWSSGNKDALILRRLLKPKNHDNDIKEWIQTVKQKVKRFSTFIDFVVATGLRKIECINSYNLIIDLAKMDKLNDYYSENILQHFRFHKIFLRTTKKAFISIIPANLADEVVRSPRITTPTINKLLKRRHIPLKFSDIREFWATAMTRYLSQPEIDFLQGRVSSTFMHHYFNPALIHDLKDRTLAGISNLTKDETTSAKDRPEIGVCDI